MFLVIHRKICWHMYMIAAMHIDLKINMVEMEKMLQGPTQEKKVLHQSVVYMHFSTMNAHHAGRPLSPKGQDTARQGGRDPFQNIFCNDLKLRSRSR
jgi:hypothetical protein